MDRATEKELADLKAMREASRIQSPQIIKPEEKKKKRKEARKNED